VVWSNPQLGTTEQGDPVVVADTQRVFAMFGTPWWSWMRAPATSYGKHR
jgi:hypothetical protein